MHMDKSLAKLLSPIDKKEDYAWLKITTSGFKCALCTKWNNKKLDNPFVWGSKSCKKSDLNIHVQSECHVQARELEDQLNSLTQTSWKEELKKQKNEETNDVDELSVTPKILNVFSLAKSAAECQPNPVENNTIIVVDNGTFHNLSVNKKSSTIVPILPKILPKSQMSPFPAAIATTNPNKTNITRCHSPAVVTSNARVVKKLLRTQLVAAPTTVSEVRNRIGLDVKNLVGNIQLSTYVKHSVGAEVSRIKHSKIKNLGRPMSSIDKLRTTNSHGGQINQAGSFQATKAICDMNAALLKRLAEKNLKNLSSPSSYTLNSIVQNNTVKTTSPMNCIGNNAAKLTPPISSMGNVSSSPICCMKNLSSKISTDTTELMENGIDLTNSSGDSVVNTDDINEDEAMEIAASLFIEPSNEADIKCDSELGGHVSDRAIEGGYVDVHVEKPIKEDGKVAVNEEESDEYTASSSSEEESSNSEYDPKKDEQASSDSGTDSDELLEKMLPSKKGQKTSHATSAVDTKSDVKLGSDTMDSPVTSKNAVVSKYLSRNRRILPKSATPKAVTDSIQKTVVVVSQKNACNDSLAFPAFSKTYEKINRLKLLKQKQHEEIEKLRRKRDHQSSLEQEGSKSKRIMSTNSNLNIPEKTDTRLQSNHLIETQSKDIKTIDLTKSSTNLNKVTTPHDERSVAAMLTTSSEMVAVAKRHTRHQSISSEMTMEKKTDKIITTAPSKITQSSVSNGQTTATTSVCSSLGLTQPLQKDQVLFLPTGSSVAHSVPLQVKRLLNGKIKFVPVPQGDAVTSLAAVQHQKAQPQQMTLLRTIMPKSGTSNRGHVTSSTTTAGVGMRRLDSKIVKLSSFINRNSGSQGVTTTKTLTTVSVATTRSQQSIPNGFTPSLTSTGKGFLSARNSLLQKPVLVSKQMQSSVPNVIYIDKSHSTSTSNVMPVVTASAGSYKIAPILKQATQVRGSSNQFMVGRHVFGLTISSKNSPTVNSPINSSTSYSTNQKHLSSYSTNQKHLSVYSQLPLQIVPHALKTPIATPSSWNQSPVQMTNKTAVQMTNKTALPSSTTSYVINNATISSLQLQSGFASQSLALKVQSSNESQNANVSYLANNKSILQQQVLSVTASTTTLTSALIKPAGLCSYTVSPNSIKNIAPVHILPSPSVTQTLKPLQPIGGCVNSVSMVPPLATSSPLVAVLNENKSPATVNIVRNPSLSGVGVSPVLENTVAAVATTKISVPELRPSCVQAGTQSAASPHTTPDPNCSPPYLVNKNINGKNVWYIVGNPFASSQQPAIQPVQQGNSVLKIINLVNIDKHQTNIAIKKKGSSPKILLQSKNFSNSINQFKPTIPPMGATTPIGAKHSSTKPSSPSVPIKLGVKEKLFRMANDKEERWTFLPDSYDKNFTYLLGYEVCLKELSDEYFGFRDDGVDVGIREYFKSFLKKKKRASLKPRVVANRVKKVIEVICSDCEDDDADLVQLSGSVEKISKTLIERSAKRGNLDSDESDRKRIKLSECSETNFSPKNAKNNVDVKAELVGEIENSLPEESNSCEAVIPEHVTFCPTSATTNDEESPDDMKSCFAVVENFMKEANLSKGSEEVAGIKTEEREKMETSKSSSSSCSDLPDFRLLSPSKLNPKVLVEKIISYAV